jgi:uncharacterized protein with HEPN domain
MHKDDEIRLRHMLDAAREAQSFTQGQSRKDLDLSRMLVLALVKDIEIVGEAAARVSEDVQPSHREIPWADIIGMRHRLIHAYFEINLDILWETVVTDLPPLIASLEKVLPTETG